MFRMKKGVTLYNVMFPIWFLIIFPVAWIVVLPVNFIIDTIVLLLSLKLLRQTGIKDTYKRTIVKVWLIGFASDFIGAGILFLTTDSTWPWIEYLDSVSWNPFDNWYALLVVALAVLASGVFIYLGNFKISFRSIEIPQQKKRMLALALAVFTAPYVLFYPSALINGTSWDGLNFMTNHIIKRDEFRLEVTVNQDGKGGKTYVMSRYEHEVKVAINNADRVSGGKPGSFPQPDYIFTFYSREYSTETAIPLYINDNQGYFEYENDWYELNMKEVASFMRQMEIVQNTQGKKDFTISPNPKHDLTGGETEALDKEGKDQPEYPIFQDSRNKYYCRTKHLFDTAVIRFEGREEIDLYTALESGLITPQELIDRGMPLIVEPR